MNELENQLAELLKKGIKIAESTGEFVIDQAPELLQEFYRWHIISNVMGIVISFLVIFLCFKFFKMCGAKEEIGYKETKILNRFYETDDSPFFFLCLFCGGLSITMLFMLIKDLYDLVKIIVAPKIYLIEYFI